MRLPVLLTCALLPLACSRAATPPPAPAADKPVAAAPQAAPPAADAAPAAAPVTPLESAGPLSGRVVETIDSGGYTYLRLQTASGGQTWAAVRETKVANGAQVTVVDAMAMDGFESPRLKRRFDHIVFGRLQGDGDAAAPAPAGLPPGHPAPERAAPIAPVAVEKAAGANARTVAEVHAQRKTLQGQPVVVRGQVVKFLPGIMGRNWAHLRDGSGSAAGKDDDLTVTTADTLEVGSVVTVSGTVSADKDFGAGYAYAVIVEGATLAR